MEPLQYEDKTRLTIFPIQYLDIWNLYKKSVQLFWTAEEIDLSKDGSDWTYKLNDDERHFLKTILAFFGVSDTIVNVNLAERFINDVGCLEAKYLYGFQQMMENIHSEVYSILIDTYITNLDEKTHTFKAVETYPCITDKINWCRKWIDDDTTNFATRLVAFAIVEGIYFSGSFAGIFHFKDRGILMGLMQSNALISRDEALHVESACLLFKHIKHKPSERIVQNMVRDAVSVEQKFIIHSLRCDLVGMNSDMMGQYIQFVADRLLKQLGYNPIYHAVNPFPFMERISIPSKVNFFEGRVSEYRKLGEQAVFSTDEIF